MKYYGIDLTEGSEITNLTVPTGTAFPSNPNDGELFYRTDLTAYYGYQSGSWQTLGGGGTITSNPSVTKTSTTVATEGQTAFSATYTVGYLDVFLNGSKLVSGDDYTATDGTSFTLTIGASIGDVVETNAYGTYTNLYPRRNAIINGNFDIWQRAISTTSTAYAADRWYAGGGGGATFTHTQQAFTLGQTDVPNNPTYYARYVATTTSAVGEYCTLEQRIEGVETFSGQTVTLSFWAKADASKNIATEFIQNFGTTGSPSATVNAIGVTTHVLTTAWQQFTVTTTLPSISGKTLGTDGNDYIAVAFWFDAGSNFDARTNTLGNQNGTFDIAQIQLESGSAVTEFEYRTVGEELALCQRYYEKSYNFGVTPGTTITQGCAIHRSQGTYTFCENHQGYFNTTKRAVPTVTWYSTSTGAAGYVYDSTGASDAAVGNTQNPGTSSTGWPSLSSPTTAAHIYYAQWTADAEL